MQKVNVDMDNEMKSYLEQIAIKTKIENFMEFGKTRQETVDALMKKFKLSEEQAVSSVDIFGKYDVNADEQAK